MAGYTKEEIEDVLEITDVQKLKNYVLKKTEEQVEGILGLILGVVIIVALNLEILPLIKDETFHNIVKYGGNSSLGVATLLNGYEAYTARRCKKAAKKRIQELTLK